jgi:hypothetical protein
MYKLGHRRSRSLRNVYSAIAIVLLVLFAGGYVIANRYIKPNTTLSQDKGLVSVYGQSNEKKQVITEASFKFELPANWKKSTVPKSLYQLYRWQGTSTDDAPRQLDIYVDDLPTQLPVNRLLPVEAANNRITVLNTVSDNCSNFTGTNIAGQKSTSAPAKWSGVDFICDLATYTRNVTGTGSAGTINQVSLTGERGKHSYFIVYTDNSSNPDYGILTQALQSFRAL